MTNHSGLSRTLAVAAAILSATLTSHAAPSRDQRPEGFRRAARVDVLVDGQVRPQYLHNGTVYIEAVKGREFQIRVTNPFPVRAAVALAVDGLNSIDARHTTATDARKWVLDPFETITLSGWQVSQSQARRFVFTTEARSYGKALGQTQNLGVITAVFFRERVRVPEVVAYDQAAREEAPSGAERAAGRADTRSKAAGASAQAAPAAMAPESNEYAATGIGRRTDHRVHQVSLDLEDAPAASVSLRYEFRTQLVKLGVLPLDPPVDHGLARRERSRGFEPGFCPDPKRW